jgi:hypothetical protein
MTALCFPVCIAPIILMAQTAVIREIENPKTTGHGFYPAPFILGIAQ